MGTWIYDINIGGLQIRVPTFNSFLSLFCILIAEIESNPDSLKLEEPVGNIPASCAMLVNLIGLVVLNLEKTHRFWASPLLIAKYISSNIGLYFLVKVSLLILKEGVNSPFSGVQGSSSKKISRGIS